MRYRTSVSLCHLLVLFEYLHHIFSFFSTLIKDITINYLHITYSNGTNKVNENNNYQTEKRKEGKFLLFVIAQSRDTQIVNALALPGKVTSIGSIIHSAHILHICMYVCYVRTCTNLCKVRTGRDCKSILRQ